MSSQINYCNSISFGTYRARIQQNVDCLLDVGPFWTINRYLKGDKTKNVFSLSIIYMQMWLVMIIIWKLSALILGLFFKVCVHIHSYLRWLKDHDKTFKQPACRALEGEVFFCHLAYTTSQFHLNTKGRATTELGNWDYQIVIILE